jgi:glycine/D-amino acid oxidase-like deaminating enzyme
VVAPLTAARRTPLWDDIGGDATPRAALAGDRDADVAIVGAGFTGLWTAYYLARSDPSLRVAVLEAETAGFGASGRNGGWCSALWPGSTSPAMRRALEATVDEVGLVADAEGIDAGFRKGGSLRLARSPREVERLQHEPWTSWLSADEARSRVAATNVLGGAYDESCAAIHPGRLVRGLARAVERRGVTICERTPVHQLAPKRAATPHGTLRADVVVRATEGYTPTLERRALAPVYSLVIATEPLPHDVWERVGWGGHETVADGRRLIIYAQRTLDDRIVFGGRGAPYHFASAVKPAYDDDERVHARLHAALVELLPVVRGARVTHAWGGPLGVPRDFTPSVRYDAATGLATAGGYVGDGVAASNLAGRTLADLILGRETDLTALPWVGHRSRRWEPEPLRWLGINATRWLAGSIDRADRHSRHAPIRAAVLDRMTGH